MGYVPTQGLELEVLFQFCVDVVDGMTYLIQQKFVHRDLAARNCMYVVCRGTVLGVLCCALDVERNKSCDRTQTWCMQKLGSMCCLYLTVFEVCLLLLRCRFEPCLLSCPGSSVGNTLHFP